MRTFQILAVLLCTLILLTKASQNYHDLWIPRYETLYSEFDQNAAVVRPRHFTVINQQSENGAASMSHRYPRLPRLTKKSMEIGKSQGYMIHLFTDIQLYSLISQWQERSPSNDDLLYSRMFVMTQSEIDSLKRQIDHSELVSDDIDGIMDNLHIESELQCSPAGDQRNQTGFKLVRSRLYFNICKNSGVKDFETSDNIGDGRNEDFGIVIWAPALHLPFITTWTFRRHRSRIGILGYLGLMNQWVLEFPPVPDNVNSIYRHISAFRLRNNDDMKPLVPVDDQMVAAISLKENDEKDDISECPVCLNDLNNNNDVKYDDLVRPKACEHKFHRSCLKQWLETKPVTAGPCPSCRWGQNEIII